MKHSTNYIGKVGIQRCPISEDETMILHDYHYREILEDQEGGKYFIAEDGETWYFDLLPLNGTKPTATPLPSIHEKFVADGKLKEIEMEEVGRNKDYIFWQGTNEGKEVYNITPIGSYKPYGGYYSKEWIMGIKNQRIDLFAKQKPMPSIHEEGKLNELPFTGGDWTYRRFNLQDRFEIYSDSERHCIAKLDFNVPFATNAQVEADAKLLTEAKNMYLALKELAYYVNGKVHDENAESALHKAKAIINRIK